MLYRPKLAPTAPSPRRKAAAIKLGRTDERDGIEEGEGCVEEGGGAGYGVRRGLEMELGVVKAASGSSVVVFGGTRAVAQVHGPRSIKRSADFGQEGVIDCSVKLSSFCQFALSEEASRREVDSIRIRREQKLGDALMRALKPSVRLDRFPKSQVDVSVLLVSDDGCAESVIATAASVALANSGIELFDLTACATVGIASNPGSKNPRFITDPDSRDEAFCKSFLHMAILPASEQVSDLTIEGAMSFENVGEATKVCFQSCARFHGQMKDFLLGIAKQEFSALNKTFTP